MGISAFDYVVLKKDTNMKVVQILPDKPLSMCKMKFTLNGILGHSFGSMFVVQNGQLVKVSYADLDADNNDQDDEVADAVSKDNRRLVDSRENQQLSKEHILTLRKQGVSGDAIVEQLIENSATFSEKTEFSQQKYIKKKKQKHVAVLTVLKPNARTLVEMYYNRGPTKICNLRLDSLSQILTHGNVRAGSRLMVVESCNGLLLGAILERMSGCGQLVHLYTGSAPSRQAVTDGFHFSHDFLECLHSFPLELVSSLCRTSLKKEAALDVSQIEKDAPKPGIETSVADENASSVETADKSDDSAHSGRKQDEQIAVTGESDHSETMSLDTYNADGVSAASNCDIVQLTETTMSVNAIEHLADTKKCSESKTVADSRQGAKRKWKNDDVNVEERERRRLLRQEQIQNAKSLIEAADMDGLIIAAKLHPTPIVCSLLNFIKPSRPVVVFSPYKEPLVDCYLKLRESGRVLLMSLSETWLRSYQILPDRTHPSINMSGTGGYLLTATVVGS